MDLVIRPELERFVAEKLKEGRYAQFSDVVNDALELLQEQEQFTSEHEAFLRREVRKGLEQLEGGQLSQLDAEQIIADERLRLAGTGEAG